MPKIDGDEPSAVGAVEPTPEGLLVKRFVDECDEAAFAALVERYGTLVFSLCRRVLQHEQDAEDAFQATFLVLARKAGSIGRRASVGSWLYRVAFRIAQRIKAKRLRLPVQESGPIEVAAPDHTAELVWRDLRLLIDEEVNHLPAKQRHVVLLCYFEGKSYDQAAAQLGWPPGTVASQLSRARDRLRRRLKRRGIALSAAILSVILVGRVRASVVPPLLAQVTAKAALRFAKGQSAGGSFSANSHSLAASYLRARQRVRLMRIAGGLLASILTLATVGFLVWAIALRTKPDSERIQGIWTATRTEIGGQLLPSEGTRMTFRDDRWQLDCRIFGPNDNFTASASFVLDPRGRPKSIDFIDQTGARWPGIYELNGNTLKICFNFGGTTRPQRFASPPDSQIFLYHLERE